MEGAEPITETGDRDMNDEHGQKRLVVYEEKYDDDAQNKIGSNAAFDPAKGKEGKGEEHIAKQYDDDPGRSFVCAEFIAEIQHRGNRKDNGKNRNDKERRTAHKQAGDHDRQGGDDARTIQHIDEPRLEREGFRKYIFTNQFLHNLSPLDYTG
jgi:hypothetical protein